MLVSRRPSCRLRSSSSCSTCHRARPAVRAGARATGAGSLGSLGVATLGRPSGGPSRRAVQFAHGVQLAALAQQQHVRLARRDRGHPRFAMSPANGGGSAGAPCERVGQLLPLDHLARRRERAVDRKRNHLGSAAKLCGTGRALAQPTAPSVVDGGGVI